MNYNNINSVINDYLVFTNYQKPLSKSDMRYTANRMLQKLLDVQQYIPKIGLFDVKDYKIKKPTEFYRIIQVSYKNTETKKINVEDIVEYNIKDYSNKGCDIKITKECEECPSGDCPECDSQKMVINIDRLWDLSHPEFRYSHMSWLTNYGGLANGPKIRSNYHNEFNLIRCTNDPLFSVATHIKGCTNLLPICNNSEVEYRVEDNIFRFNVKEGQILLVYLARPVDSQGYLLVPNVPDVYEAIKWAIEENVSYQEWRNGDPNSKQFYDNANNERLKAMGRARAVLRSQSFTEFWKELAPYYGKHLPVEDGRGNVTDQYDTVMDRLSRK